MDTVPERSEPGSRPCGDDVPC